VLRPLHEYFASTLYDVCSPFTKDPDELVYISAARWPGFVQPLLDEHQRTQSGMNPSQEEDEDASLTLPKEDVRMPLIRFFTPSISAALEVLYPRLANATDWAKENIPEQNLLSNLSGRVAIVAATPSSQPAKMEMLPRMSKFILVAAFLASTNPATSDMRIFGRRPEERKKRRRKTAARVKSGTAKVKAYCTD
jgi:origin recognition complex subunit 5